MSLKDRLKSDMTDVFLNTDQFAETIIYKKRNGTQRTIKAIVYRDDERGRMEVDHGVAHVLSVYVTNDATLGVSSSEWDNGDSFIFSRDVGGDVETLMLTETPMQDEGGLLFHFGP